MLSPENYFEFHIKVSLNPETDVQSIHELCKKHEAHLSRNAFKKLESGEQRYLRPS